MREEDGRCPAPAINLVDMQSCLTLCLDDVEAHVCGEDGKVYRHACAAMCAGVKEVEERITTNADGGCSAKA